MLQIKNLSKRYGDKTVVDNLSLHILPGEIYGFIGHNGAGKTTTIKCATGLLEFEDGEIFIDGMSIQIQPLRCKEIFAYTPDNPDIYDYMTDLQLLNLIADVFQVDKAES
ncbi:MAG: ATP-binding cassette domain-containing protein, partial [Coriobacteriales bacterium]|nr:ATP-binding cassette domain-containing protein [Coriobacteriales bacterium]